MSPEATAPTTAPKPFVFVLMPFDSAFNDIYKFGIKGAAQDAGAYAERVDEQIFTEGILERVLNQINKADVIVADMTGRNPNVFYEVGYAHALGKIVLLLTQDVSDIPFDLKHHQHTVYGGRIETLREELSQKIEWAIEQSRKAHDKELKSPYLVSVGDTELPFSESAELPVSSMILADDTVQYVSFDIRNKSLKLSELVTYVYLFTRQRSVFRVHMRPSPTYSAKTLQPLKARLSNPSDELLRQYRLKAEIPALPPGTSEVLELGLEVPSNTEDDEGEETFRIRIHGSESFYDYYFKVAFQKAGAAGRKKYGNLLVSTPKPK